MPLAEFELVMLDSGEVALQRAEGDETLVTIRFSPDVLDYLDGKHLDVAKSMMDAGIKAAFDVIEEPAVPAESVQGKAQTIH
jgi:hypothetical protein